MTILRIALGMSVLALFNLIAFYYFKNEKKSTLYCVLFILNFSWIFPYVRTLFSSEIMSSLFFFGAIFLYDIKRNKGNGLFISLITGFLLGLSFYFRFQMGFAIVGFGLWILLFDRKFKKIFFLLAGFLIAAAISTYLDYQFYHRLVCTPYHYFYVNINEGVAASFGIASFMVYIGLLVAVITAPPLSILLIGVGLKALHKKIQPSIFYSCNCIYRCTLHNRP